MSAYEPALALDRDAPEFARGVEVGRLWTLLTRRERAETTEIVHVANAEMVLRLAEVTDHATQATELDETWLLVTFSPAR